MPTTRRLPIASFAADDAWTTRTCVTSPVVVPSASSAVASATASAIASATASATASASNPIVDTGSHESTFSYDHRLVAGATIGSIAGVAILGAVGYWLYSTKFSAAAKAKGVESRANLVTHPNHEV
eukprot:Opistho-2@2883